MVLHGVYSAGRTGGSWSTYMAFMLTAVLCKAHQPTLMGLCPVLGRLLPLVKEFSSLTEKGVWNEETQSS